MHRSHGLRRLLLTITMIGASLAATSAFAQSPSSALQGIETLAKYVGSGRSTAQTLVALREAGLFADGNVRATLEAILTDSLGPSGEKLVAANPELAKFVEELPLQALALPTGVGENAVARLCAPGGGPVANLMSAITELDGVTPGGRFLDSQLTQLEKAGFIPTDVSRALVYPAVLGGMPQLVPALRFQSPTGGVRYALPGATLDPGVQLGVYEIQDANKNTHYPFVFRVQNFIITPEGKPALEVTFDYWPTYTGGGEPKKSTFLLYRGADRHAWSGVIRYPTGAQAHVRMLTADGGVARVETEFFFPEDSLHVTKHDAGAGWNAVLKEALEPPAASAVSDDVYWQTTGSRRPIRGMP